MSYARIGNTADHANGLVGVVINNYVEGFSGSGGAGIQADLKTFTVLGTYGASVITALTAQNPKGVTAIHDVPAQFVAAQMDAIFSDLDVGAVKIGLGRHDEAEGDLRQALVLAKDHTAAMSDLAVLLASTGRPDEARRLLDDLLEIRPDDGMALQLRRELDQSR